MSIRNVARSLAAVVLVGAGFVGTAQASTIAIVPGSQTIAPGATAGIDIVLTGLTAAETVGAFSIVLSFNDTVLDGVSFSNDPGNKMGAGARDCINGPCDLSNGFTGGSNSPLDLFYNADLVTPEATLHALQTGAPFVLAHVDFKGAVEGLSPVTLGFKPAFGTFLSDFDGDAIALTSITIVNGCDLRRRSTDPWRSVRCGDRGSGTGDAFVARRGPGRRRRAPSAEGCEGVARTAGSGRQDVPIPAGAWSPAGFFLPVFPTSPVRHTGTFCPNRLGLSSCSGPILLVRAGGRID